MSVSADVLLDRIKLKAQLTRWRIIGMAALGALAFLLVESTTSIDSGRAHIGRFHIEGIIFDDHRVEELLQDAAEDDRLKALIVSIDSPGGTVTGGEQLFYQLQEISKKKPVVATIRNLGASAAYMAAIGTDRIYAMEGSLTGSIGVLFQTAEATDLANRLGINPITIKSTPLKAAPSFLEKSTPEAERAIQNVIDDTYGMFKRMVAERRNLSAEELAKVSDGRVFTGSQALKLKLIDAIGGESQAVEWLEAEKGVSADLEIRDLEIEEDKPALASFMDGIFQHIRRETAQFRLDGLVAIWQP